MNSYPFTSQVTYDEQGLPKYDRAVDSAFLRKVFAQYFSDGIFYEPTSALQVTIDTGMNVKVLPGVCHIQGAVGIEEAERVLAVQASETQDRIDTVVARLDLSLEARSIDLYVVKGAASESPVAPALTRNSTIWELGLADIFVAKNTATITQQRITDTRLDNSRCGMVAQTIGTLDTSPYFTQVQAMISDLEETIAGIEGGSGFVFSLSGKSGHLTLEDVGAQPQTTARKTMVKADESGELIEAADGVDYFSPASLDPQWTFPTLQNGYTADAGQVAWTPRYGKSGNVVEVSGLFKTWDKGKSAFVLPEEYRPNNNITSAQMVCTRGGTIKRPALMTITSKGSVQVYNTDDNGDEWLFFHCTFITA